MTTPKKTTGLGAFTRKPPPAPAATEPGARSRAKGETVAVSIRFSRPQWERLRQLADHEGTSLQQLALSSLSRLFEERGLPKL